MQANKESILRLLKIVRGQMDGLIKMVEEDRYCIEISDQILSSQSLLKKINFEILQSHFNHCVQNAFTEGSKKETRQKTEEFINILNKIMK